MLHHLRHFAAQYGDLPRIGAVGRRSPQSEKAFFTDQAALGVEVLDADVVEVSGPMDGGHQIGLGHEHDVA